MSVLALSLTVGLSNAAVAQDSCDGVPVPCIEIEFPPVVIVGKPSGPRPTDGPKTPPQPTQPKPLTSDGLQDALIEYQSYTGNDCSQFVGAQDFHVEFNLEIWDDHGVGAPYMRSITISTTSVPSAWLDCMSTAFRSLRFDTPGPDHIALMSPHVYVYAQ